MITLLVITWLMVGLVPAFVLTSLVVGLFIDIYWFGWEDVALGLEHVVIPTYLAISVAAVFFWILTFIFYPM